MKTIKKKKLGFIGLGFVGKNLYDNFKNRGYNVVGYSKKAPYNANAEQLKECDIVFIAVPTPTTERGFDSSIIRQVIKLPKDGTTVVIKSTVPGDIIEEIQKDYPKLTVIHSPEFLDVNTAKRDTDHPYGNILGVSNLLSSSVVSKAKEVMEILPFSENEMICTFQEATLIKYVHNCSFYMINIYWNMAYDFVTAKKANWETVLTGTLFDKRISIVHSRIFDKKGRGAGGACLIKDFSTFTRMYEKMLPKDEFGKKVLNNAEARNIGLLKSTGKDVDLLEGVYGKEIIDNLLTD